MSGIGGLMGALGAVNGLSRGYMQGQEEVRQQRNDNEDRAYRNELRGRQRKQWQDEDRSKDHLDAANRIAQQVYEQTIGHGGGIASAPTASAQEQQQAAPQDGGAPMPSSADSGGISSSPRQPSAPSWDQRGRAVVKALEAKSEYLLKNAGPGEAWASAWGTAAKARDAVRAESMDRGEAEYRSTGDASALIKSTYPYIDDGYDLVDASTTTGKDGKPVVRMTRVSRDTGKEESMDMAPERVEKAFGFLRDPAAARKIEAQSTLERARAQGWIDRIDAQNKGRVKVAQINADARTDAAETAADSRVQAARISAGGVQSVQKLGDGTVRLVMRDRSSKTLTDDSGNPVIGDHATKAVLQAAGLEAKSIKGISNTTQQNVDAGVGVVQGISGAMKPKPQQAQTTATPQPTQKRPPIDSFMR